MNNIFTILIIIYFDYNILYGQASNEINYPYQFIDINICEVFLKPLLIQGILLKTTYTLIVCQELKPYISIVNIEVSQEMKTYD
jgi:hypothetical protein